jgi:DNA processing protein
MRININKIKIMDKNTLSLHCFNTLPQIGPKSLAKIQESGAYRLWLEGNLADFETILGSRVKLDWYQDFSKLNRAKFLEQELDYLTKSNIKVLTKQDESYPQSLLEITTPPTILYIKGDISGLENSLAIVGTRKYTPYGARVAEKLSRELSESGIPIISGLALGIDSIAHRGCLDGKSKTIAVLGGGISPEALYPKSNQSLANAIIASGGALISEFPPRSKPRRENFVLRNRIVSGIARGILIIEAPIKSGTMTTVKYALEQNRDVFAIPGNIDVKNSEGTNQLIKQGAYLVTQAEDILNVFGLEITRRQFDLSQFEPEQREILQYLIQSPLKIERLAELTKQEVMDIMATLSILELSGVVTLGVQGEYSLNIEIG